MKPLFIVVPILLIGGTVGAAFMGVINVPGVTPAKKAEAKAKPNAEPEQTAEGSESEPSEPTDVDQAPIETDEPSLTEDKPATPQSDPVQGAKALAKYWDAIETNRLLPITDTYSEPDLARILIHMQKSKVAEILGAVTPDRAAKLSRELQKLASVVPEQEQP
jgi:hypothetical protein